MSNDFSGRGLGLLVWRSFYHRALGNRVSIGFVGRLGARRSNPWIPNWLAHCALTEHAVF